jgi:hypothetical protein
MTDLRTGYPLDDVFDSKFNTERRRWWFHGQQ